MIPPPSKYSKGRLWIGSMRSADRRPMTAICVRREKAALSSGCKSHPANAPAGSNRSSHGGDEMAEAFGVAGHVGLALGKWRAFSILRCPPCELKRADEVERRMAADGIVQVLTRRHTVRKLATRSRSSILGIPGWDALFAFMR